MSQPSPRAHHIQMKYLLIRLMLREPEETFAIYTAEDAGVFLGRLWDHVAQELPADDHLPSDGLAIWHRPANGELEAVVLALPAPQARNEAWFIGAFRTPDGGMRVFCLERSFNPMTSEPATVLAEVRPDGRANWGPVEEPLLDYFLEDVDAIIHDPEASPLTFTAIPLG